MRTHVALLRGINVGGTSSVAMAELRRVLGDRGFTDVVTYIQSGNVALTSSEPDPDRVGVTVAEALREDLGVPRPVVAFDRAEYAAAVAANPFGEVTDPKQLHAVFRAAPPDEAELARLAAALEAERRRGGPGAAVVVGRVVYLHLPDGIGRSELGSRLSARTAAAADGGGTARNWRTVRRMLDLLG
ncbi:DUF1697 domain-containing protein [Pseudonocardia sp. HH130630-07]|uniref:DUF1697 domain-containing protein n=1 Tax=Pseudonocardia sp. HH130630-07 TaxID=1690815 RepID=UPI000814E1E5|nr:DUF1697 domain-containing protein [Pseudonocardia sp. HH130630-07]ANY07942.1 hypothetical protein AFB00_18380 [Pseudonocardia sp. HH130630-07]